MMRDRSPEDTIIGRTCEEQKLDTFIDHLKKMLAEDIKSEHGTDIFNALTQLDVPTPDLLIPLLRDPDKEVRSKLSLYLIASKDKSLDVLKQALKDPDRNIRRKAIDILGEIHSQKALTALIEFLGEEDNDQVMLVVEVLKRIGSRCVPALIEAFDFPNPIAKNYIAYTLWGIGDRRAMEKLLAALSSGDPDTCGTAAMALGQKDDAPAARALIEALLKNGKRISKYKDSGDPKSFVYTGVQAHIAAALVKTGPVAVPMLVSCMREVSMETSRVIISILGKIGGREAIKPLVSIASYCEKIDDKLLLEVLAAMESAKSPLCVGVLSKILQAEGKSRKIHESAIMALQAIETDTAEQVLMENLQNREASIRFYAALALEKRKCYKAIPHLLLLLRDSSPLVAARAMATLEKFGAKALPVLFSLLDQNSGDTLKARDLIKRIGTKSVKNLQKEGKQKDERKKAIAALHLIIQRASELPSLLPKVLD